ncbi:MAG: DUF2059 domain-containing protein [Pseudomonadota bacterium]
MTRRALRMAALLLAASAAAAPAWAQPAPVAAANPAREALALELATMLNSETTLMGAVARMLDQSLPNAMMANADVADLERQYPGLLKEMIDAMKPVMIRHMRAELPELWRQVAALYAANLTEADMRVTLAFYRSPAGARIIELMIAETDFEPVLRDMAKSNNYDVPDKALTDTVRASAGRVPSRLTPAETDAAMRFGASPEGRHVVALTPRVQAMVIAWSSQPTPELDAELERVTMEVVEKRLGVPLK